MIQVLVYTIKQPITGNYLINHTIKRYVRTHNSNQIKREEQRQFIWTWKKSYVAGDVCDVAGKEFVSGQLTSLKLFPAVSF